MKIKLIILFGLLPAFLFGQEAILKKLSPLTNTLLIETKSCTGDPDRALRLIKDYSLEEKEGEFFVNAFIEFEGEGGTDRLSELGVQVHTFSEYISTARIPLNNLQTVASVPQVKRLQIGTPVTGSMDKARKETGVEKVQAGLELPHPFKAKDIVVGIIDDGFEYGHINFYDSERKTSRIKRVWNQNGYQETPPQSFTYGTEYATESDILSARHDNKVNTHGTHVAGIAVGADLSSPYYGVATEADIVLVSFNKNSPDNVLIADGIKYIFDYAASVGKPCVINLSLGSFMGPHDGTSTFDRLCDEMQGAGKLLVGAAGNEANKDRHMSGKVSPSDTLKTFLSRYGYTDIWGEKGKKLCLNFVVYSKSDGKELSSTQKIEVTGSDVKTLQLSLEKDGASGKIVVASEINPQNDKPNIYLTTQISSIGSDCYLGMKIWGDEATIHAWGDSGTMFGSNSVPGWTGSNPSGSLGEVGGTGKRIISVASYVSKNEYVNSSGEETKTDATPGSISAFSSKGPTPDGRMKPEIAAPGEWIVSSFSSVVAVKPAQIPFVIYENQIGYSKHYYGIMNGTSMAAPHVSGILAVWLQAKPDLTPEEVRTVFEKTAIKDTHTGEASDQTWGYGKIDAWNGLKEVIRLSESGIAGEPDSSFNGVIIYPASDENVFSLFFPTDASQVRVTVYSTDGRMVRKEVIGTVFANSERNIDLRGVAKGIYIIRVEESDGVKDYRLCIK